MTTPDTLTTLRAMHRQAKRWLPGALILGNIRAADVVRACDEPLRQQSENKRLRNVIWEAFYEMRDGTDARAFAILKEGMEGCPQEVNAAMEETK